MFVTILLRTAALVGAALLVWSMLARPSVAHGPRVLYRVRADDTLWSIAASHYGGDPGSAVWRIERTNRLSDDAISPGEVLVLP